MSDSAYEIFGDSMAAGVVEQPSLQRIRDEDLLHGDVGVRQKSFHERPVAAFVESKPAGSRDGARRADGQQPFRPYRSSLFVGIIDTDVRITSALMGNMS